ncbi:peptide chain release factor 1, mitochondrial isoform X1 [Triplophysa rosa]|uniref:peptide chain release factor 1, mitochondrial isoform X1 n=1 Tax=Triplophysa rosa TaxID=992332 RepID=UPI0025461203|nr:peptide chain release factor 1, mitochondrial isoform X1 [Triplophysa rosa]
MSVLMAWVLRRVASLQTVRRWKSYKSDDFLKHEAVQKHIKRVLDEYWCVSSRLEREQVSESERKGLNHKLVHLSRVVDAFDRTQHAMREEKDIETLIHNSAEEEQMLSLLREEHADISRRLQQLKKELIETLVHTDDGDDGKNVILEVAAGRTTGGDICQQFTREMLGMYQHFANYKNWHFDIFNYTAADYGGLHHAAVRISGDSVYRWLKFEGGTHRVQRIPEVGLSSRMQRIHTGTVTVIVLLQPDDVDIHIEPRELRIDTFKSRGAGGQSVNTTDSAVRILHLPTGTVAECQQFRSQLKNRDTAMRVLRARLYQSCTGQQREHTQASRKQQVGSRSQSERIRTYNFSQDRVTDHRSGHVMRDIKEFMRGGESLEEMIRLLQEHTDRETLLKLLENNM